MHIPDGYLSPATCAALYGGSAPFWYIAIQRLKRTLHTRVAPLLSLFSAFAFIVMMFNVPLPGGTTGHAVGVTIASIVLGPWGSIVSISVALIIQAVLFGDGGITTLGANCFNMAIIGSLVAYFTYRTLSGNAPIRSPRRVFAAGVAGYLSINVCALAAAIELGIQPLFFHDAYGAPLYAPYPLHIAIPAMMIGHLTIAGLAELVVSAGVVAYLQRAEPSLLTASHPRTERSQKPWLLRPVWLALALLLILTPLGIQVAGSAWGEWTPEDFRSPETRRQMMAASADEAPPAQPPAGLQQMARLWTAPMPRYAPEFPQNASAAYLWSAIVGTGFIVFIFTVIARVSGRPRLAAKPRDFIERTLASLIAAIDRSGRAESLGVSGHALQRVDPRVKLAGIAALILATVMSHRLEPIIALLAAAVILGLASGISLRSFAVWVWSPVFLFSGLISVPAIFLTAGPALHWGARTLPATLTGLRAAMFLTSRAETAATLTALLVLTTPWPRLLKALRIFRVPPLVVTMLGMTCRYAFTVLQTALDMFESRKSRAVGLLSPRDRRQMASASAGVLLSKSLQMSGEVHEAMLSRGFRGDVHVLDEFALTPSDWCWLAALPSLAGAILLAGR